MSNKNTLPGKLVPLSVSNIKDVEIDDWIVSMNPISGGVEGYGEVTAPANSIGVVFDIEEQLGEEMRYGISIAFPPGIICMLDDTLFDTSLSSFCLMKPSKETEMVLDNKVNMESSADRYYFSF